MGDSTDEQTGDKKTHKEMFHRGNVNYHHSQIYFNLIPTRLLQIKKLNNIKGGQLYASIVIFYAAYGNLVTNFGKQFGTILSC